jgi:hypothetical protein
MNGLPCTELGTDLIIFSRLGEFNARRGAVTGRPNVPAHWPMGLPPRPCHNAAMAIYRIVELNRDKISGWTVQGPGPGGKNQPRMLYRTREQAQAEADRLAALDLEKA